MTFIPGDKLVWQEENKKLLSENTAALLCSRGGLPSSQMQGLCGWGQHLPGLLVVETGEDLTWAGLDRGRAGRKDGYLA